MRPAVRPPARSQAKICLVEYAKKTQWNKGSRASPVSVSHADRLAAHQELHNAAKPSLTRSGKSTSHTARFSISSSTKSTPLSQWDKRTHWNVFPPVSVLHGALGRKERKLSTVLWLAQNGLSKYTIVHGNYEHRRIFTPAMLSLQLVLNLGYAIITLGVSNAWDINSLQGVAVRGWQHAKEQWCVWQLLSLLVHKGDRAGLWSVHGTLKEAVLALDHSFSPTQPGRLLITVPHYSNDSTVNQTLAQSSVLFIYCPSN